MKNQKQRCKSKEKIHYFRSCALTQDPVISLANKSILVAQERYEYS